MKHRKQLFLRSDDEQITGGQLEALAAELLRLPEVSGRTTDGAGLAEEYGSSHATGEAGSRASLAIATRPALQAARWMGACWKAGIPFHPFDPQRPALDPRCSRVLAGPGTDEVGELAARHRLRFIDFEQEPGSATPPADSAGRQAGPQDPPAHVTDTPSATGNAAPRPEDLLGFFTTSGTSGCTKTVPLRRRQMLHAARVSAENFRPSPGGFWLLCLPLHHMGGAAVVLRSLIYETGVHVTGDFDAHRVLSALKTHRDIEVLSLVPTMLKRLLDAGGASELRQTRAVLLGGGPANASLVNECREHGVPVVASYGMTETCGQIAAQDRDQTHPPGSVGQIFEGNEIHIAGDDRQASTGNTGTRSGVIWLRGPQVIDAYMDERDTRPAITSDGWLNTGDWGHMDAWGNLFVESRRDDLIVSGGMNIVPAEVEQATLELSGIEDCAVAGVEDAEWGQATVAFIVTGAGTSYDRQSLRKALAARLPGYKLPRHVIPLDQLPRKALGKVRYDRLRALARETLGS